MRERLSHTGSHRPDNSPTRREYAGMGMSRAAFRDWQSRKGGLRMATTLDETGAVAVVKREADLSLAEKLRREESSKGANVEDKK
jgi:hypothetical protein